MNDDTKAQWSAAWVRAWAKMPPIPKTHKAKIISKKEGVAPFEYKYADLPDIIDAVRPILAAHGLSVGQSVEPLGDELLGVVTRVYHEAGHVESFGPTPMPAAGDPRTVGSAITYARRYSLSAALGIASDEDTDAEGTQGRRPQKVRPGRDPALPAPASPGKVESPEAACKRLVLPLVAASRPAWTEQMVKDACHRLWPDALKFTELTAIPDNSGKLADTILDLLKAEK